MDTVITAEHVSFAYPGKIGIVEDFNLKIRQGEFIGIIGPSGAGKTTLLRLLSGYLRPDSGQITAVNKNIADLPPTERARLVALVPQELFTPTPYSVHQMVAMGRAATLSRFRGTGLQDDTIIEEAMHLLEIDRLAERRFNCLSGGEKQRTVIAMALAQQSRLIMLDEPTSALDIGKSLRMITLLEKLNREKGVTILIVSHDIQLLSRHCQRLLFFANGNIRSDGAPDQVVTPAAIRDLFGCEVELLEDSRQRRVICPVE